MDAPDRKGAASARTLGAKCAFLGSLDAKLAARGYPVQPPAPAPPEPTPAPALTFEAWAELSVRFADGPTEGLAAALAARGLTIEVWKRFDEVYGRALSDDLRAGKQERPAVYEARYQEEVARRGGHAGVVLPLALPDGLGIPHGDDHREMSSGALPGDGHRAVRVAAVQRDGHLWLEC